MQYNTLDAIYHFFKGLYCREWWTSIWHLVFNNFFINVVKSRFYETRNSSFSIFCVRFLQSRFVLVHLIPTFAFSFPTIYDWNFLNFMKILNQIQNDPQSLYKRIDRLLLIADNLYFFYPFYFYVTPIQKVFWVTKSKVQIHLYHKKAYIISKVF